MKKLNSGITLIALIITIIVLLILAGVSVTTLVGENGIITKAQDAKKLYEEASEKESLEMDLFGEFGIYGVGVDGNEGEPLGLALYDKTFENANRWCIAYDKKGEKTYGTGWRFVSSGTEYKGKKYKHSFLINYTTGEIKEFNGGDSDLTILSYNENVGVSDSLIFNLDCSLISSAKYDENGLELSPAAQKQKVQQSLGNSIELIGMNFADEKTGITNTSFDFDGVDDLIRINNISLSDFTNGLTYEFHGQINNSRMCYLNEESYATYNDAITNGYETQEEYDEEVTDINGNVDHVRHNISKGITHYSRVVGTTERYFKWYYQENNLLWAPFFEFAEMKTYSPDVNSPYHWSDSYKDLFNFTQDSRFGVGNGGYFANFGGGYYSVDFGGANPSDFWNVVADNHAPTQYEDIILQISVDPINETIKFYEDGEIIYEHEYLKEWWEGNPPTEEEKSRIEKVDGISYVDGQWVGNGFLERNSNIMLIGGFTNGGWSTTTNLSDMLASSYGFTELKCYNIKVYNRALSTEELKLNREKDIAFHQLLESQNN